MNTENGVVKEREISLLDLLVEILLHWRSVLLLMVIGGVIFAGISYVQSVRTAKTQQALLDEQNAYLEELTQETTGDMDSINRQWLEDELTELQINNVNNVILNETQALEKEQYRDSSLLMQLDAMHVQYGELIFLIRSEDLECTYNIERVYEDVMTSVGLFDYVRKECAIEENVNELILLEAASQGQIQGQDTLRIGLKHSNREILLAMMDAMVSYVEQQADVLAKELGSHEVVLLHQSVGELVDQNLLTLQKNYDTDIANLRTAAIKLKAAFTEEEWKYYNFLVIGKAMGTPDAYKVKEGEATEDKLIETIIVSKPGVNKMYIVLGALLFTFIYVFCIFISYIFNSKLRVTDQFQTLYGIAHLGTISHQSGKRKLLGVIDEAILKLRYLQERRFDKEEALVLSSVAVKMSVKKNGLEKVSFVGCNLSIESLEVCKQMKTVLEGAKIQVDIVNNVLYDAEMMEKLEHMKAAVLIETVGSTLYNEIESEIELLKRQNVQVLGGIVVEK